MLVLFYLNCVEIYFSSFSPAALKLFISYLTSAQFSTFQTGSKTQIVRNHELNGVYVNICIMTSYNLSEKQKIKQTKKKAFVLCDKGKEEIKLLSAHNLTSTHFSFGFPLSIRYLFIMKFYHEVFVEAKFSYGRFMRSLCMYTSCRYKYLTGRKAKVVRCLFLFRMGKVFCFYSKAATTS